MNTYIIEYNGIDGNNSLFAPIENIEGKNPADALLKRFGKKFKRVTGDEARCCDVALRKGFYNKETNSIRYESRSPWLAYNIMKEGK